MRHGALPVQRGTAEQDRTSSSASDSCRKNGVALSAAVISCTSASF